METWQAIRTRRNVRGFADRPVEPEKLDRILDAGRHAPSSMNEQRWAFILVRDRDRLKELAQLSQWAGHVESAAAAVALITPHVEDPEERESIEFDLGQAVQNMMLAAWELGIGSCHASAYEPERAREALGFPEGWRCGLVVSLGYPADPDVFTSRARKGGRKAFADVVHRERW